MADKIRRLPPKARLVIGPFVFDRSRPAELACAKYLQAAPPGGRAGRMRDLLLAGFLALPPSPKKTKRVTED